MLTGRLEALIYDSYALMHFVSDQGFKKNHVIS